MKYDSQKAAVKLKKEFDRIRYTAYFMIGLVICVILVSALRKFWLTLIIIAATVFIQLFVFRKMQKDYVNHAVEENIRATIGQLLHTDQVVMKGKELMSEDVIRDAALVPVMDKSGAINLFTGVAGYVGKDSKKMKVTSCDVTIAHHQEGTKISAEILCGNWIHIALPENTNYHFTVKDGQFRSLVQQNEKENIGDISDEEAANGTGMPERFYGQLEKLEDYTTGILSMRVDGDMVDVFLKDRFLAANFSARGEVTKQMIDWNPMPELEKVLDLVWTLI
jgi:hypothetical protein